MEERKRSKQISVRFDLVDWVAIEKAAEEEGIKPAQYVRSTVLQRLNGKLIDAKSIDMYIRSQNKENLIRRRGF